MHTAQWCLIEQLSCLHKHIHIYSNISFLLLNSRPKITNKYLEKFKQIIKKPAKPINSLSLKNMHFMHFLKLGKINFPQRIDSSALHKQHVLTKSITSNQLNSSPGVIKILSENLFCLQYYLYNWNYVLFVYWSVQFPPMKISNCAFHW